MSRLHRAFAFVATLALVAGSLSPARAQQPHAAAHAVDFVAPAGMRPAGSTSAADDFGRILPSGRILHPAGTSVVVGMNALGFALTPDGKFAIVSNDDEREGKLRSALDPQIAGGYSLAVVDTATMTVVSRYASPLETYFAGVVAVTDPIDPTRTLVLASGGANNAVYAFDLDGNGSLAPDAHHVIAIPAPSDARFANAGHAFPATLVRGADDGHAYVVDQLGDDVAEIVTASRSVEGTPVSVGFFPFGAALSSRGLVVANEGLASYGAAAGATISPPFANVAPDLARASSLTVIPSGTDGSLVPDTTAIPLDRAPDGIRTIGGAHPAAVVALRTKPYAFVALANVDRVVTVSLVPVGLAGSLPAARAVGGTELRLYDRGPYGTQPTALALSADEKRLYVALSGIDAVAVLDTTDPVHPHRVGLIPTGWYPDSVALSSDGRYLYVANAKGIGEDRGFVGDEATSVDPSGRVATVGADANAIWSTFERIDLQTLDLRKTTPNALSYLRTIEPSVANPIVPQRFASTGSGVIKHVVLVLQDGATYDAMLGDLTDAAGAPYGPGDAGYVSFDASVTPNVHALARTYGLAGNLFADAEESGAGHQFASAGIASDFTEKTALVDRGRGPLGVANEDPEDYPRAGYVFDSLANRGKTYRDYGDLVDVSGYTEGDANAAGFGGTYALDVPAPAVLGGHVDPNYAGRNAHVRDVARAQEFVRDFDPLVKAGRMPAFTEVWLPAELRATGPGAPSASEAAADGDRALGTIVDYLTHTADWQSTAIFIMPADAESTRDHVDEHRSYAIVVSPYAKRHYLGTRHVSTVSVLKTEEEILGLPALSLGDALATDMSDYFTPVVDLTPYAAVEMPVSR